MSTPSVKQFFNNKVTIRLKDGHLFEGLLSQVNYKNHSIVMEDVEDLGNQTDKNFIPHHKKIAEKAFESDNIEQILFKQKHFCEAKKYNKDNFWDAVSEPVPQQTKHREKTYGQRNEKPYYKKNYYENRDNRGGENRRREGNYNREGNREGNNYRNYNQKERGNNYRRRQENTQQQENDRDYR